MSIQLLPIRLPEVEGAIDMIYGGFGGGKTYLATELILEYLERGVPVYSSFPVQFDGIDERKSLGALIMGILGFKRKFKVIGKENFHHITMAEIMSDEFVVKLADLVECVVVVDEAYAARLFDSYRKTNLSVEARMAVYATRHFDRRFIIVAQRPNSIHVSSRAMVNRFYKCDQPLLFLWYIFGIRLFTITEYQELKQEEVNEEAPHRTRIKIGKKHIFRMYDSKYMRRGKQNMYPSDLKVYKYSYFQIWKEFISGFRRAPRLSAGARQQKFISHIRK